MTVNIKTNCGGGFLIFKIRQKELDMLRFVSIVSTDRTVDKKYKSQKEKWYTSSIKLSGNNQNAFVLDVCGTIVVTQEFSIWVSVA